MLKTKWPIPTWMNLKLWSNERHPRFPDQSIYLYVICWELFKCNSVGPHIDIPHWKFLILFVQSILTQHILLLNFGKFNGNYSRISYPLHWLYKSQSVHITFIKYKYTCRRLSKYGFINTAIVRLGTDNWIVSTAGSLSFIALQKREKTTVDGPYLTSSN